MNSISVHSGAYVADVPSQAKFRGSAFMQPIPELKSSATALDYHQIPVAVESAQNAESLVNVKRFGIAAQSAYATAAAPYYQAFDQALNTVYVRSGVATRLLLANEFLREYGVELLALDGWRPIQLQQELWDHFIEKGKTVLDNPSEQQLQEFAGTFCSCPHSFDPSDFRTWPVHITGGAIDVTLRTINDRQQLFMGAIFDDADHVSATRFYEQNDSSSQSALEARRNRRLLYHAMAAAGFVNYPHEWWHFDFGTQMWVMNGGPQDSAFYGLTNLAVNRRSCAARLVSSRDKISKQI